MKYAGYLVSALLLTLFVSGQPHAQTPDSTPIVVEQPWARATPAGAKTGVVYLTLMNNGASGDRLLSATTPAAEKVQFHSASEENGVSRMREVQAVEVGAGAKTVFSPGGLHIMMIGLKQPLKDGQTLPLTLTFEKAGKVEVVVSVAKVGAMQHGNMSPMMHRDTEPTMK